MRVTRIEIFGFKSFMDRLVLPLEPGITGVVGPNGCGKSNIVDAIRWILGETRASSLRGGVLEDIIFNGTDKLRPLGLAEVSMTVRASGHTLLADLRSPVLDIDAALEEALAEVQAVEAGSGEEESEPDPAVVEAERPKLTVIPGGLDDVSSAEDVPTEQPSQEPHGEETDSALQAQSAALALKQFPWLEHAAEVQITRRLYRSGDSEFFINRIPCRLKDIKDFFRAIGIAARGYTLVAQGEVARIVTAKPQERRYILEEAAGVHGFRDRIAAAQRRLGDTEVNVSRLSDIIKEVERQVGSLKRQAERARNRQALKDRIQEREMAIFRDSLSRFSSRRNEIEAAQRKYASDGDRVENALQAVAGREMAARGSLMEIDLEGDALRTKIDALKEELHNRARQRSDSRSRVNELRAFALGKRTEIQRLEERQATLGQRRQECAREIGRLEAQEGEVSARLGTMEGGSREELQRLGASLQNLRNELRARENELRSVRDQLISRESALESIREQLVSASPLNRLEDTARTTLDGIQSRDFRMLVEGLAIPPEHAKAVQAVLAERAAYIITDDPHALGARFSQRVREVDPENRNGLGLGAYRLGDRPAAVPEGVPFPSLLESLEIEGGYGYAAVPIFEKCFLAGTIEAAVSFFEKSLETGRALPAGITLVTQDGDLITEDSFFSFRHQGGVIQLKGRVVELEKRIEDLRQQQSQRQKLRDEVNDSLIVVEQQHKEALAEAERRHALIKDLSSQQGSLRGKLQAECRIQEQIESDMGRAARQIEELHARIAEYEQEEKLVAAQLEAAASVDDDGIRRELDGLTASYTEIDRRRKDGRQDLESLSREVQAARQAVDEARAEISRTELAAQRLGIEQDALREKITVEYGTEVLNDLLADRESRAVLEEEIRVQYTEEVHRLRERIMREGEVDPESVDRYEAEKERLLDLRMQRDDLEKAGRTLRKTITRLTDTAEKRFVSVFNAVERNFSRLVPQLFGGGRGTIELSDPSKPLESGIEILMRPPGKKPKSIDLLSGGEKALTAVALIFAMFLERPSPLCVLDEVDAPLDDANLLRFLNMVKEMSLKTQFVMITHNKQSMAVSDHLVGVTMEEPGASRVISVSLQEAYSQVA